MPEDGGCRASNRVHNSSREGGQPTRHEWKANVGKPSYGENLEIIDRWFREHHMCHQGVEGYVSSLSGRTCQVIGHPWTKEMEEAWTAWSSITSATWFEWNLEYLEPRFWRKRTRWPKMRWTWLRWCWRQHWSNQATKFAWSWSRIGSRRSVQVRSGMLPVWQVRPLRKRMQIGNLLQLWQGRSYSKILSNWRKGEKSSHKEKWRGDRNFNDDAKIICRTHEL